MQTLFVAIDRAGGGGPAGGDGGIELSEFVSFLIDGPSALDLESSSAAARSCNFEGKPVTVDRTPWTTRRCVGLAHTAATAHDVPCRAVRLPLPQPTRRDIGTAALETWYPKRLRSRPGGSRLGPADAATAAAASAGAPPADGLMATPPEGPASDTAASRGRADPWRPTVANDVEVRVRRRQPPPLGHPYSRPFTQGADGLRLAWSS